MRPLSVLIADDAEGLRSVLRSVMEAWGHRVSEAANGEEAVEAARREKIDLALLDLEMPHLDGARAQARIAQVSPETICVMMTGSDNRRRVAAALRRGARACLRKPFSLKAVEAIILEIEAAREAGLTAAVPA